MPTASQWFYCGSCGFKNHPRLNGKDALAAMKAKSLVPTDDTAVCEQCGAGNSHPDAVEAKP